MSEPHSYPLEILRTELKLAMAEQLVQLMERFASKQDLATFKQEFAAHQKDDEKHFHEINTKLDALLTEKDQRDGADRERRGWLDSRRFTSSTIVALSAALIAAVTTLATHLF